MSGDLDSSVGSPKSNPLDGMLVIEMGGFEAAPLASQMLAQLGADVIKIEPPKGDPSRHISMNPGAGDSHLFFGLNWNKRSVVVDVRTPEGSDLVHRILRRADVLIENFRPGVMARLGFGYEELAAENPRLVYASIKGFAATSPYTKFASFDPIAQAVGGATGLTGEAGAPPVRPGLNLGDTSAGLHCTLGILAALLHRERTGRGQRVEVPMQAAVLNFLRAAFARHNESGQPAERQGNNAALMGSAPSGVFRCAGGGPFDYCVMHTSRANNDDWHRLLGAMGRDDLLDDERFASPLLRWEHRDEVEHVVTAWTAARDKFEVMETLGGAGVPVGAIHSTGDIRADESLYRDNVLIRWEHPERGSYITPGFPIRLSTSAVDPTLPPSLGEDTEKVLVELLGLAQDDLRKLADEGVVVLGPEAPAGTIPGVRHGSVE